MDSEIRDVRRVISRQSVIKNNNNINNKRVISGELKKKKKKKKFSKEKIKRLSVVEREMGFEVEDSGKLMLPKKIFSDSNTSVPRKLRSAIRKRSCESPSRPLPDARRSNSGVNDVDLPRKDSLKKSKITTQNNGQSNHSSRGAVSVTISKDEEEVAETLFALAGMIPRNGRHVNNKTEKEAPGAKMSEFSTNQDGDTTLSSEDPMIPKEEPEASDPTTTTNSSPRDSTIDHAPLVWPTLSDRRQLNLDFKVSVPLVHFQIPPLLRACDDRKLSNPTIDRNQESRLDDLREEKSQLLTRESHINLGAVDLPANQDRQLSTSTQCRDNGSTSGKSHGSGIDGLPVRSSAMNLPSWLNNASISKPSFGQDTPSTGTAGSINVGRKSRKRCLTHVYISRLIQVLQTSEGKGTGPLITSELKPSQQSFAGQAADNDGRNGNIAAGLMYGSAANGVPVTLKNGHTVENEEPTLSGCCDSKQNYNFLSLSTGVGQELNNGVNRVGITLEARGQVLQLHSIAHQNTYVANSMPQIHFPTISHRDHVAVVSAAPPSMSTQVHFQVPSYFGNPCESAHNGTRLTQQPQPKQQQMWTAQLPAQFRPGVLLSSHIANWKNSTRDPRSMNQMQAQLPSSQPSLGTIGSKYLHISQQQQQQQQLLGLRPSFPTSNAKLQNSQLPSLCEDKGGRFPSDGVLPLQLLCNERLLS